MSQNNTQSDYLEKNIKAISRLNKPLASALEEISLNKYYMFQGEDNLAIDIIDKVRSDTIYTDPVKNTEDILKDIESKYALYPIMYFFGIGNGIAYKALLNNEYHKRIVIFEPEIEIIHIALSMMDFSDEIQNTRLVIIQSSTFNYAQAFDFAMSVDFKVYAKLYNIFPHSDYYLRIYPDEIQKINKYMTRAIKQMVYSHGNDAKDSLTGIEHHLKNLPQMVKSHKFLELVHKKNTKVAVIVSTGPSLDKQLVQLKKIQKYVTIISPDASLKLLEQNGIKPDIVTSLERTQIVSTLIEPVSKDFQKDIIFLLSSVLHKDSIKAVKGEKAICMRPFGYTFFFEDLKEWGYHGIGMSVSNMAHELAFIMKYEKVVLIGQDLSYGKDGQSHSDGNVYGKNQRKMDDRDVDILAYGAKGTVKSNTGWILFKNYFEKTIDDTKDKMTTYNATEGGARIDGAIEIPFDKFIKENVDFTKKKEKITLTKTDKEYANEMLKRASQYVDDWVSYTEKIQKQLKETFLNVANMSEKIQEAKKKKDIKDLDIDEMVKVSDEINKQKQLFQEEKFSKLYFDVVQSFIMHQEFDLAHIIVMHPQDESQRVEKLMNWIEAHKYWLFSLSGGIDAIFEIVKKEQDSLKKQISKI